MESVWSEHVEIKVLQICVNIFREKVIGGEIK
jgi:hypothetical protein